MRELEEAIRYIHENPRAYPIPTGKNGGGYICPICGSGSGSHKTEIMSDKNETWKFTCFARGCFPPKSDTINIIGAKENLDNKQALFRAFEIYGITLKKNSKNVAKIENREMTPDNFSLNEIVRIKADIKNSVENLSQAEDYLRSCEISLKNAIGLKYGYVQEWYHPKVLEKFKGKPPFEGSPRLIIPTSEESYLARDIRLLEEIPQEERGYVKQKAGNAKILNIKEVSKAKSPIFIVEGEFDLMSIAELGHTAIALGSTSMIEHLMPELEEKNLKVEQSFVISPDNVKAGQTNVRKLEEKPVLFVFVDYLQILEPTNPRGTDKQIVDHSIKSLNILSRSLKIPIVVAASAEQVGLFGRGYISGFKRVRRIEIRATQLSACSFKRRQK